MPLLHDKSKAHMTIVWDRATGEFDIQYGNMVLIEVLGLLAHVGRLVGDQAAAAAIESSRIVPGYLQKVPIKS